MQLQQNQDWNPGLSESKVHAFTQGTTLTQFKMTAICLKHVACSRGVESVEAASSLQELPRTHESLMGYPLPCWHQLTEPGCQIQPLHLPAPVSAMVPPGAAGILDGCHESAGKQQSVVRMRQLVVSAAP